MELKESSRELIPVSEIIESGEPTHNAFKYQGHYFIVICNPAYIQSEVERGLTFCIDLNAETIMKLRDDTMVEPVKLVLERVD